MSDAVKMAKRTLRKEIRYCSPACASFDLFENYEDRGNQFKQAVQNL
jgi:UDP-N-acetylmuramoylalanine--D-glutamate ligase